MSWQSTIERTVQGLGYDMVEAEFTTAGLLRVYIDRMPEQTYVSGPGEFVTVEDCELVTRQLQYVLEVDAVEYERLEVSSPGVDRPLRKPADWLRFSGADVELALREPFKGRRRWTGRLVAREGGFSLVLPPADGAKPTKGRKPKPADHAAAPAADVEQTLDFSLDEVREARLVPVIDFKGRRELGGGASKPDGGQNR